LVYRISISEGQGEGRGAATDKGQGEILEGTGYYSTGGTVHSGHGLDNTSYFNHLQSGSYWSDNGYDGSEAWTFRFSVGSQSAFSTSNTSYALAVHPGLGNASGMLVKISFLSCYRCLEAIGRKNLGNSRPTNLLTIAREGHDNSRYTTNKSGGPLRRLGRIASSTVPAALACGAGQPECAQSR
jgi:hypothetical protein